MMVYESVDDININNVIIERNEVVKEIESLNKENKLLQDMDKILRNENTNLKLEIKRLNKQMEEYQKALDETTSEKIDLENIIKEKDRRIHLALGYMENCSGEPDWRHVYAILDGVDDTYDKN